MKQKIVIKVQMTCEKCRKKTMQILAPARGVKSVALDGEISEGKVIVIGDDADAVALVRALRKKLKNARLESVEEVKEEKKKKDEAQPTIPRVEYLYGYPYNYYPKFEHPNNTLPSQIWPILMESAQ